MSKSHCPSRSSLEDLATGRLPLEHHEAVEEHVSGCAECQAELVTLDDLQDPSLETLRELLDPSPMQAIPPFQETVARLKSLRTASAHDGRLSQQITASPFPKSLGDFRILRELGRGGMGIVYEAEQLSLRRHVALKTLPFASLLDSRQLQRFQNESRAAASLEHPNIVAVYGVGVEQGVHYYAMRYIDGENLARIIEQLRIRRQDAPIEKPAQQVGCDSGRPGPSAVSDLLATRGSTDTAYLTAVVRIGVQAAQALDYAHRRGVVHRDIKPSNLMLDQAGRLWVTDFGLARVETDATLSMSGSLLGTMRYMSPEQVLGNRDAIDHRTDIYSLGATLYEMLTLNPIFPNVASGTLLSKIATDEPRTPRHMNPAIPADLETIVLKALAKDAADRYATAGELADDLQRFLDGKPIRARPVGSVRHAVKWARRRPALAGLLAVSALAILGLLIGGWWHAASLQSLLTEVEQQRESAVKHETLASERERRVRHFLYAGDMKQAFAAWNNSQVAETLNLLKRHRPQSDEEDLRSFVWYYLWRLCHSDLMTFRGHDGIVHCVAFSPDGKTLATGSHDGTVKLWDAVTGKVLATLLKGHTDEINTLAFSPDGKTLATGSDDRKVRLWDATSGQERTALVGHTKDVYAVAFSPDGKTLASGGRDRLLKVWDTATGKELASLAGHQGAIESLAYSPDGKTLATASGDRTAILWDLATRQPKFTLRGHDGVLRSVAFSHDGQTLATGEDDRTVKLWNPVTGQERAALRGHPTDVRSVAFSADDRTLAAALSNGSVWLWDVANGQKRHTLEGHTGRIWNLSYSPDGNTLATASGDGTAKLWNANGDRRSTVVSDLPADAGPLTFASDGEVLTWLGVKNRKEATISCELWTLAATPVRRVIQVHHRKNNESSYGWSAFNPTGDALATVYKLGDAPARIEIYDVPSASLRVSVNVEEPGRVNPILPGYAAWSADGRTLATLCKDDARIMLWDAVSGSHQATLQRRASTMPVWAVVFSPDGKTLVAAEADGTLTFWDARTWRERDKLLTHPVSANGLAFVPDSQLLATAGSLDRTIKIWDVGAMRERATLQGHAGTVNCLAFSADGKTLASGSDDGTIRLWDTYTWQELITLDAPQGSVRHLVFSSDGRALASSNVTSPTDNMNEIAIWSAPFDGDLERSR